MFNKVLLTVVGSIFLLFAHTVDCREKLSNCSLFCGSITWRFVDDNKEWVIIVWIDCKIFKRKGSELIICKSLNNCIKKWGRASLAEIKFTTSLYTFSRSSSNSFDLFKKNNAI